LAEQALDAYAGTPAAHTRNNIGKYHGHEPGDPVKAAGAIFRALEAAQAPLRLALGADAVGMLRGSLQRKQQELADWEAVSVATAFDAA
jgi:hypothetical protein